MKKKFDLKALNKKLKKAQVNAHDASAFLTQAEKLIRENSVKNENSEFYIYVERGAGLDDFGAEVTLATEDAELTFDLSNDHSNCGLISIFNLDLFINSSISSYKKKLAIRELNKFIDLLQEKTTTNTAFYTCLLRNRKRFNDLKALKFVTRSKHVNKFRTKNNYYLMTRDVVRP